MPYIDWKRRPFASNCPETEGELNFAITVMIQDYILRHPEGLRYKTINEVIGALEGAKAEFQRRIVGPYEDRAIAKNGDVYLTLEDLLKS